MINMLEQLPVGILDVDASGLHEYVEDHTLVHIAGKNKQPIFVSILQHGDETTGWDAIKAFLTSEKNQLPRSLYLFFGNVQAAAKNLRQLDGQTDLNRCWPGLHKNFSDNAKKLAFLTDMMAELKPFASVDIHNNSGRNPHYAGINSMQPEFVNLAALFSETIIHFTSPDGIQSGAFASFCPSVTIECGMSGTADGTEHTRQFLAELFYLSSLKNQVGTINNQEVLNIFSTIKIKPEISLGIASKATKLNGAANDLDFMITDNLDHLNFQTVETNTVFGHTLNTETPMPLIVTDPIGNDITHLYFEQHGLEIRTKQKVVPAMITQSVQAIRLDCLCYFMHPLKAEQ